MEQKKNSSSLRCYLCSEIHPIHKCILLPADKNERIEILQKAADSTPCWKCGENGHIAKYCTSAQQTGKSPIPCWKCGEIGHLRKDCTSTQTSAKPPLSLPPIVDLDIASVLGKGVMAKESNVLERYSGLLAKSLQRDNVKVLDVGLVNDSAQHENGANNWNSDRKSFFIVATAS